MLKLLHGNNVLNLILTGFLTLSLLLTAITITQVRSLESEAKGKPVRTNASLTVIPNPVPLGTNITINGSGFSPGQTVLLNTSHIPSPQVVADANGNFSYLYNYTYGPGNAAVVAYVMQRKSWVQVATTTFTICVSNPCQ